MDKSSEIIDQVTNCCNRTWKLFVGAVSCRWGMLLQETKRATSDYTAVSHWKHDVTISRALFVSKQTKPRRKHHILQVKLIKQQSRNPHRNSTKWRRHKISLSVTNKMWMSCSLSVTVKLLIKSFKHRGQPLKWTISSLGNNNIQQALSSMLGVGRTCVVFQRGRHETKISNYRVQTSSSDGLFHQTCWDFQHVPNITHTFCTNQDSWPTRGTFSDFTSVKILDQSGWIRDGGESSGSVLKPDWSLI